MTSKAWYLLALGFFIAAIAIGFTGVSAGMSAVEEMHRVAMPGSREIVLPGGTTTLYLEGRSNVDGVLIEAQEGLAISCALTSPAGTPIALEPVRSRVEYAMGSYAGANAFDVQIATPGTYVLACDSATKAPFAIAIGGGIGTWIVVALVGGLVPAILAVVTVIVVFVKRSRQKRRLAAASSAPV